MRNAASIVVFPRTEYAAEPMDAGDCVRFERRDPEWIMADFMAGGVWWLYEPPDEKRMTSSRLPATVDATESQSCMMRCTSERAASCVTYAIRARTLVKDRGA